MFYFYKKNFNNSNNKGCGIVDKPRLSVPIFLIIAKMGKKGKQNAAFFAKPQRKGCGKSVEKNVDRLLRKLGNPQGGRRGKGEGDGNSSAEEDGGGDMNIFIDNVEKEGERFSTTVDKNVRACYNGGMQEKLPDFARICGQIGEKQAQFDAFYALLLEYNERFNLTAVTEKEEVFHKHFLDSVAGEGFLPRGAVCIEVGSGAGFPSIPLKIVREDLTLTLVESTGKKCVFLKEAVRALGLKGVEVVNARAEELGQDPAFREKFGVAFARAVARLNVLAEYCMPLVRVGGSFLAYKGDAEEEIREAEGALRLLGGGKKEVVRYDLPEGYGTRTLLNVQKEKHTPKGYPRGHGMEKRSPIV